MEELLKNFEYYYKNFAIRPGDRFQITYLLLADMSKYTDMEGLSDAIKFIGEYDDEILRILLKLQETINEFNKLPKGNRTDDDFDFTQEEVDDYEMVLDFDNYRNLRCLTSESRVLAWFEKAKILSRDEKIDDIIS